MTWIERTAYPQFKRLTSARVLHVFFTPSPEEVVWAEQRTGSPESCFALVLALKCFQKMARFPSPDEIPHVVIDHVRRCLELAEDIWPDHGARRVLAVVTGLTKVLTGRYAASRDGVGPRGRLRAGTALIARGEFSIVIVGLAGASIPSWRRWWPPTCSSWPWQGHSSPASPAPGPQSDLLSSYTGPRSLRRRPCML